MVLVCKSIWQVISPSGGRPLLNKGLPLSPSRSKTSRHLQLALGDSGNIAGISNGSFVTSMAFKRMLIVSEYLTPFYGYKTRSYTNLTKCNYKMTVNM